ncbi:hypothetical protein C1Y40_05121 [Mycobacterium talmoniae]|uniref:Uncharacterized protein n=1 Tax=Mycobacterium talmoniae TaxID=1858794 RepID=A0A2S8BDJ5_9MYCO|nr:hypothetical protein C1Y40_05121 [Mycobacterium talmoniae]
MGGRAGWNVALSPSTNVARVALVIATSPVCTAPVSSRCNDIGMSPRRCVISSASIAAHRPTAVSKPSCSALIRSSAVPCASPTIALSWGPSSGSRNVISPARISSSPSAVFRVNRDDLPSATQRRYAPVKQSACCSATSIGVDLVTSRAMSSTACPYSCASAAVTDISPK